MVDRADCGHAVEGRQKRLTDSSGNEPAIVTPREAVQFRRNSTILFNMPRQEHMHCMRRLSECEALADHLPELKVMFGI
jgi:hypothetical protein